VHVAVTGETSGYYADFAPLTALAKVLEHGFFHDGTYSSFRGRNHGAAIDTTTMPASRLVVADQNHDQIGNRATGERMGAMVDADHLAVAAVLTLTSPFTPMLFMGEEWGASTPWQFFTAHPEPELGRATAEGRIKEFAQMGWDPDAVPDPQDPETFERSKLNWDELHDAEHARLLALYRALLALRRSRPELTDPRFATTRCLCDETDRTVVIQRDALRVVVNLADAPMEIEVDTVDPTVLLATRDDVRIVSGTRNGAAVRLPGCAAVVLVGSVSA
jgi:maltooligosyltrehalose trehalohydrolase